ncbi:MAG: ABC transporter substrate-binding protein [Prevotella sp.]|uniref:ABC transporter substrate-binding protein n=1 Tax=Prevotella sp. TaxID=59823 RepID=UPI0025D458CE|nr:ABC transporter substrate-binding protein [Prevotella sp.]MCI7184262.1 ABC transporter substrate-binding protein [Prevotella sp.]
MDYAKHITIVKHDGYTTAELSNPWHSDAVLHRYVLVNRKDSARMASKVSSLDGTIVYTPVHRGIIFSAPHCYLLDELGAADAVRGVCDLNYINLPYLHKAVSEGRVADCGNGMSPSVERIVSVSPDALFVTPFEGVNYGQLANIGVPLVECADYMETSALGRAEWMKFYGMLVGRENEADSLFNVVKRNYSDYRQKAMKSASRPRVITERVVSGVWYCPGGESSMGQLLRDAGVDYVFADDKHSGSLTFSPEKVIEKAANADWWLFVNSSAGHLDRNGLLTEYAGYKLIKAFRQGNVLECVPGFSNPYFEQISFRPDFLLADFISWFHPELRILPSQHYYKPLK